MAATNGHVAKFTIAAGRRDEAVALLEPMFAQVAGEPGALLYIMHVSPTEPDAIYFYERYADDAAFAVHSSSEAHDAALEGMLKLIAMPWQLHWLELEFGKGLPVAGEAAR